MELNLIKLPIRKGNVALKIAPGHFATNHSHINYYIDVTTMKTRLSEAQAVAKELVKKIHEHHHCGHHSVPGGH